MLVPFLSGKNGILVSCYTKSSEFRLWRSTSGANGCLVEISPKSIQYGSNQQGTCLDAQVAGHWSVEYLTALPRTYHILWVIKNFYYFGGWSFGSVNTYDKFGTVNDFEPTTWLKKNTIDNTFHVLLGDIAVQDRPSVSQNSRGKFTGFSPCSSH